MQAEVEGASVAHECHIITFAHHLGDTDRHGEFAEVTGQALLAAVAVEAFDHQRWFIALHQRIVHAGGLLHVARYAHDDAAQAVDDHPHGTAAVPNAFEAMSACAHDQRCFLSALRAP